MRLTKGNIKFVKEQTYDGITYAWYVAMKSNAVSDGRSFINMDENGRTTIAEYKIDRLPKTVQNFIKNSKAEQFNFLETESGEIFREYIYR